MRRDQEMTAIVSDDGILGHSRYVAIEDSFTENVGDDLPDGSVRRRAALITQGLALESSDTVTTVLATRGLPATCSVLWVCRSSRQLPTTATSHALAPWG